MEFLDVPDSLFWQSILAAGSATSKQTFIQAIELIGLFPALCYKTEVADCYGDVMDMFDYKFTSNVQLAWMDATKKLYIEMYSRN